MRTIIDLPDEDIKALDMLAKRMKKSRAELVRQSVAAYLENECKAAPLTHDIYGMYDDVFTRDALAIESDLRGEWVQRESDSTLWSLNDPAQQDYRGKDS